MLCLALILSCGESGLKPWMIGPFTRVQDTPVLSPDDSKTYTSVITGKPDAWMSGNTFNPALAVKDDRLVLLFRAENAPGLGVGQHTSTVGYAASKDGKTFSILGHPVLFPANDGQRAQDWPGGCEDPRVVEAHRTFYLTYTAWNGKIARMSVATSRDLVHWTKRGTAFTGDYAAKWTKSGSIVTRRVGEHLEAAKIHGKYWMYFRNEKLEIATSTDLIHWTPSDGGKPVMTPREGRFDSGLCEPGAPALLTERGIVLLYNGVNAAEHDDPTLRAKTFSAGQALFAADDPKKLLDRSTEPFFQPELEWEKTGQYAAGTVFVEGLARFRGKWFLAYGAADSRVGLATAW